MGNFFLKSRPWATSFPLFILCAPFDLARWTSLPDTNLWLVIVAWVKLGQNGGWVAKSERSFVFGFGEGDFVIL